VAKSTIDKVDQKINEPWNVEDIWAIFALRLIMKRRREMFLWFEKQKMKAFGESSSGKESIRQLESMDVVDSPYRETFAHWIGKPLGALMFLWITGYIFDVTCEFVDVMYVDFAVSENIASGFDRGTYIFTAGLVLSMWISKYGSQVLTKLFPDSSAKTEEGKKLILVRLATMLTLFATFAATLVTFGLPTSLLFSFGGLGGLAFGLAAKDFIANLIGGVIIAITSPFSEGDKIVLLASGGKFRGSDSPKISEYTVAKIGWYATLLMPRDKKPTIVPNGYFLGNATINHSRATHRFVRAAFEVRYEDVGQAIQIKEALNEFLEKHPNVDVKAGSKTLISNLGSAKLEMEVRSFIPMVAGGDAYYALRQDLCLEVCRVLEMYAPKSAGTTPLLLAQDGSFNGILSS
jgi:small-conductance mechanosensitive channel